MRILLIEKDLFKEVGGGQKIYKDIINACPNEQFFYFIEQELTDSRRPKNAFPIKLKVSTPLNVLLPPPFPIYKLHALEEANRYASSVANNYFDVVDIPDYKTFGAYLKTALTHNKVSYKKIILALHGNISTSIELNWGCAGDVTKEIDILEREQFEAVDAVYGISEKYIEYWQSICKRKVFFFDPLLFIDINKTKRIPQRLKKPKIYCIGRSERRKGNDIFIEIASWLSKESYDEARHIGSIDYSYNGIASSYLLEQISNSRNLEFNYQDALNQSQLSDIFSKRSLVILPVRYDTLNLVALEALFSGCPVAISNKAGVCEYLDKYHPNLPYIKIDLDNLYKSINEIQYLLDNYDQARQNLETYIKDPKVLDYKNSLEKFSYSKLISFETEKSNLQNQTLIKYEKKFISFKYSINQYIKNLYLKYVPNPLKRVILLLKSIYKDSKRGFKNSSNYIGNLINKPSEELKNLYRRSLFYFGPRLIDLLNFSGSVQNELEHLSGMREISINQVRNSIGEVYFRNQKILFRCNYWYQIARLQRILNNDLIAVTYELRILRLTGEDSYNLLPQVIKTLKKHKFYEEAEVSKLMFESNEKKDLKINQYLKGRYDSNKIYNEKSWQFTIDNRTDKETYVSIIVSLYNAEDKLQLFLTSILNQTLYKKNEVEIILVDSGSPTDEKRVFEEFQNNHNANIIYARSEDRETIQSAWNRGIKLARSPFLVFLGVDESLYPEALEILSSELEDNPEVDWVMANSLVTEVDSNGLFKNNVMTYNRSGAQKYHMNLETCYISWVGGMYRANIHERFGYYDESFSAAGDTEFKSRLFPFIKVKYIDKLLGLFLNYPDGQTTGSPKAEIEDLRSWYIFRTLGGVNYSYNKLPLEFVEGALIAALAYRKSYCNHISSDISYAQNISKYLATKNSSNTLLSADLSYIEENIKNLEIIKKKIKPKLLRRQLASFFYKLKLIEKKHRKIYNKDISYEIFNDNRYEQHSWHWK